MPKKTEAEVDDAVLENPYPIPLYLNQKYVFSLLATIEGGYAQIENVKASRSDEDERSNNISGEVGVTNAFALFGIKLGGQRGTQRKSGDTQEITSERVHTPDSLFARLREQLHYEGIVRTDALEEAMPGEYVEFTATLRKNSTLEGLETMRDIIKILEENEQASTSSTPTQHTNTGSKPGNKGQNKGQFQPKGNEAEVLAETQYSGIRKQIDIILRSLRGKEGGTFYLVGKIVGRPLQVVIVLDPNFANDPIAADLIDGQYTVLGKVVRAIPKGSSETINLLRKGALGKVSALIEPMETALSQMDAVGIDLPNVQNTKVSGPVLQVVPIAVFM